MWQVNSSSCLNLSGDSCHVVPRDAKRSYIVKRQKTMCCIFNVEIHANFADKKDKWYIPNAFCIILTCLVTFLFLHQLEGLNFSLSREGTGEVTARKCVNSHQSRANPWPDCSPQVVHINDTPILNSTPHNTQLTVQLFTSSKGQHKNMGVIWHNSDICCTLWFGILCMKQHTSVRFLLRTCQSGNILYT